MEMPILIRCSAALLGHPVLQLCCAASLKLARNKCNGVTFGKTIGQY